MSSNTRTVGYWAEVARYMLPIGHWLITAPIHKASDFARMYLDLGRLGEPEATRDGDRPDLADLADLAQR